MWENLPDTQIQAAADYEKVLVPALFGRWAPSVAEAGAIKSAQRVLDLGCGTGILARELVRRVGPSGQVVGVDPHPGMLAVAERLCPTVEFRQAVAERLPFEDRTFDAVVSQFALMFFDNRVVALNETLRVLAPGGRFAFAVWDSLERIKAYRDELTLLDRLAGEAAAAALRAPFVLGDRDELLALFNGEDWVGVTVTAHAGKGRFPSVRSMVEADLRGWLPAVGVLLPEERITLVLEQADQALGVYSHADGHAEFDVSVLIVSGAKNR